MNAESVKNFLFVSLIVNYGILMIWFLVFANAHEWLYGSHTKWFRLSKETFDALNYGAMAVYKIGILLLNLVPFIVLSSFR